MGRHSILIKMTLDDIKGGLRNAVERGESLEKAKQSFINAGYNSLEVEQAARGLNPAAAKETSSIFGKPLISSVPSPPSQPLTPGGIPKPNSAPTAQNFKALPETAQSPQAEKPEKKTDVVRIVLIAVAVIIFGLILNIVREILGIKLW